MASPRRTLSPLTFKREADRRDDAVTDATFFSLLSSTSQGEGDAEFPGVVVARQRVERYDDICLRSQLFAMGENDSAMGVSLSSSAAAATNAEVAINLILPRNDQKIIMWMLA
jgi:hypothetical protein